MRQQLHPILLSAALGVSAAACGGDGDQRDPGSDCTTVVDQKQLEEPAVWGEECPTIEVMQALEVRAPLEILPGTTIRADQDVNIHVHESGSMHAVGSEDERIVFQGFEGEKGFWSGLSFGSTDPLNELKHVTITDAGGEGWQFNSWILTVTGTATTEGKLLMTDVELRNGSGSGFVIMRGADISGSTDLRTFELDGHVVEIDFPEVGQLDSSWEFVNSQKGILVRQGYLEKTATIPQMRATLQMQKGSEVRDGGFLIIEEGNSVQFEQDAMLPTTPNGKLAIRGTEELPVVLGGMELTPGYWAGLVFQSYSPDNELTYVTIRDAGAKGWLSREASVLITGNATSKAMVRVENSSFFGIAGHAIEILEGGELTESGNEFEALGGNNIEDHNP